MCFGDDIIAPIAGTLAKCSDDYGYGVITAPNATHLHWQWVETGPGNGTLPHRQTVDDMWLIKN